MLPHKGQFFHNKIPCSSIYNIFDSKRGNASEYHKHFLRQEKDFGCIQIDRVLEMQKWADNLRSVEAEHTKLAIKTANNHYASFGPGTVNIFRNMLGLPEATWKDGVEAQDQYAAHDSKQRTLSDFLDIS